jgi:spore coat polysaccharide biosynthesis protein SpsF
VLAPFGEGTLLSHILGRLDGVADLWVATTDDAEDDEVAAAARRAGANVFRGSADDVLGRYAACVAAMPETPELVLRLCADRPFACRKLATELLAAYDDAGAPDYFANTYPGKSYPDGLDLELVRTRVLLEAAAEAVDSYEREHVTPFVYRRPERYSLVGLACPFGDHSAVRATIDTPADYEALRTVDRRLGDDYDYLGVLSLATIEPELFP